MAGVKPEIREHSRCSSESGRALIELAMVLIFIPMLAMSSFDSYQAIRVHQQLSVLAREAGNTAYRKCTQLNTVVLTESCLHSNLSAVEDYARSPNTQLSNVKFVVTVWEVLPRSGPLPRIKGQLAFNGASSKFDAAFIAGVKGSGDPNLLSYDSSLRNSMVIVEARGDIDGFSGLFPKTFQKVVLF